MKNTAVNRGTILKIQIVAVNEELRLYETRFIKTLVVPTYYKL